MKFSENWLRSHVPIQASREELAATLTAIGLEVEAVTPLGDALGQVVVARIIAAVRHPEADRLQVCSVDAGQGELLQIVCGAPNARAGLVAPLALVGAQIGELTIKAAKLRGVASNGMLCSAKELGLDSDASGLFELPDDAPVGQALAEYLGLPDASIEIKLTPTAPTASACAVSPSTWRLPAPAKSSPLMRLPWRLYRRARSRSSSMPAARRRAIAGV